MDRLIESHRIRVTTFTGPHSSTKQKSDHDIVWLHTSSHTKKENVEHNALKAISQLPCASASKRLRLKSFMCEVKMAGYCPRSFFACCSWTSTPSRSINTQKSTLPLSSHLDRTSLANIYYLAFREFFLTG